MRHFLSIAVRLLAGSVLASAARAALVPPPRSSQRLAPADLGTAFETVDLAPVAARTDPDLLVAARAVEEPIPVRIHPTPPPEGTGQVSRGEASSRRVGRCLPRRLKKAQGRQSPGLRPIRRQQSLYHTASKPASWPPSTCGEQIWCPVALFTGFARVLGTIDKSCRRRTSTGRRDYAILLLLARLGLRAGEVASMTLDDIDWEAGEMTVRGKGPRCDRLPIPKDVGEALASYVRDGRPRCATRRVFLTSRAPVRELATHGTVGAIVERALERAGIPSAHKGAHLLRHSLAVRMLRRGASLSEIGEILRHRRVDTTTIYAKVDLVSLRALAQPWPGGAS